MISPEVETGSTLAISLNLVQQNQIVLLVPPGLVLGRQAVELLGLHVLILVLVSVHSLGLENRGFAPGKFPIPEI